MCIVGQRIFNKKEWVIDEILKRIYTFNSLHIKKRFKLFKHPMSMFMLFWLKQKIDIKALEHD